ncbi:hypothetical protein [Streptomyces sp. NPDC002962]|uniref:hypothetical protein n=1 Tax=Streptomyces sp. NPDC002962 TaxID=3364674 RepID=UPI003687B372
MTGAVGPAGRRQRASGAWVAVGGVAGASAGGAARCRGVLIWNLPVRVMPIM